MDLIFRSPDYLAWIRRQPCAVCGGHGSEAAHQTLGLAGTALKAPDTHALPLCAPCHRSGAHQIGDDWLDKIIDVKMVIIKLLTRYLKEKQDGKA
jgi:hypothetical protein